LNGQRLPETLASCTDFPTRRRALLAAAEAPNQRGSGPPLSLWPMVQEAAWRPFVGRSCRTGMVLVDTKGD